MVAHEYRHYIVSGIGLRSLLDTYVYLQKETPDMDYVAAEAEKLGIAEFEAKNRALAQQLFSGGELTEKNRKWLDNILSSCPDDAAGYKVRMEMTKGGYGKIGFALHRFFVPVSKKNSEYASFALKYPFFYQHKIFLPFLPFYRVFRSVKEGTFHAEARGIKNAKG